MSKSEELVLAAGGSATEKICNNDFIEKLSDIARDAEQPMTSNAGVGVRNETNESPRNKDDDEDKKDVPKFTMIFNKYDNGLDLKPSSRGTDDIKSKDKNGSKYMMIFNKDVTIRPTVDSPQSSLSRTDIKYGDDYPKANANLNYSMSVMTIDNHLKAIEPESSSVRLNDAETLMNLYGRSNLFIPELTISSLQSDDEVSKKTDKQKVTNNDKRKSNDTSLRLYNSLSSITKNKTIRRTDNLLKNKIASLTSLETHLARESSPRKHISNLQERKLFRVRSLDLSESLSSSDSDIERSLNFKKDTTNDSNQPRQGRKENSGELSSRKSDKKSRGDAIRKGDRDLGGRKQVQWKSEVDVIYFESHQAADGDRSGEILGRVMEPLREEWEQQRTGFYAKMVPLPLGSHFNERWQSLLKI